MMEYLDKLKRKPKHVRQRIALMTTSVISLMIFSIWWSTWNIATIGGEERSLSVNEALSPVGAFAGVVMSAGNAMDQFTKTLKSKVEQVQYEASGTYPIVNTPPPSLNNTSKEKKTSSQDVVYPEQIYPSDRSQSAASSSNADASPPEQAAAIFGGTD